MPLALGIITGVDFLKEKKSDKIPSILQVEDRSGETTADGREESLSEKEKLNKLLLNICRVLSSLDTDFFFLLVKLGDLQLEQCFPERNQRLCFPLLYPPPSPSLISSSSFLFYLLILLPLLSPHLPPSPIS